MLNPMLVSPPVTDILGLLPVAAFVIVNSFTADDVAENIICSLPFASSISLIIGEVKVAVFIVGEVKVLLVKV
jgi:hypothetical protein